MCSVSMNGVYLPMRSVRCDFSVCLLDGVLGVSGVSLSTFFISLYTSLFLIPLYTTFARYTHFFILLMPCMHISLFSAASSVQINLFVPLLIVKDRDP